MKLVKELSIWLILIVSLIFIPSCAVNPVTGKRQLMLFSESQEVKMGKEYDPQVIATFGLYEDEDLKAFIEEKGTEMGKISHRPDLKYHFRILDSPVVNAFAVPGGYLYFTRGILAQFTSEAELIGVLGHEMAHVTARHTVSQQSKQQVGQLLLIGGMIASEEFRDFAGYAMQGMELLFLKFSRDDESQSDRIGVEYASKLQYDGQEMAEFFNVLHKMHSGGENSPVPTFLSTHPDPANRYENVTRYARQWKDSLDYSEWLVREDSYLDMIDGMVYGEDPRQGYVGNNAFYHPEMKFKFPVPSNWKLQNTPMQVQIAPQDGKALMIFTLAQQESLNEAAEATLEQLELETLDSERTTVNGYPAIAIVSEQVSQNQQTEEEETIKVLSYFIDYAGSVYIFHGVSSGPDFDSFYNTFETTMVNFDELTDPQKLNVKPKRIRIREVRNASTVGDALQAFGVPQDRLEEFALLNKKEVTDRVRAGERLKTLGE
ncbi:MAG: M48 family metalloprotease [Tangfeifania sp.]